MDNYQIFISYRRDGGDILAGRLADRFTALGYKVFYDVESMRSGQFNTQILDAILNCNDFLLVLPPNALDRCVNADDWVRQELSFALKHNKNIIPVMMRGFDFPAVLPVDIEKIRYMEGVVASSEYFDAVIERISKLLTSKNLYKDTKVSASHNKAKTVEITVWSPVNTDVFLNDKHHLIMRIDHNSGYDYKINSINVAGSFNLLFVANGFEKTVSFDTASIDTRLEYRLQAILTEKEIHDSYNREEALDQINTKPTAYAFEQLSEKGIAVDIDLLIVILKNLANYCDSNDQHKNYLIAKCAKALGKLAIKYKRLDDIIFLLDIYENYGAKSSYGWIFESYVKLLKQSQSK